MLMSLLVTNCNKIITLNSMLYKIMPNNLHVTISIPQIMIITSSIITTDHPSMQTLTISIFVDTQ